MKAFPHMAKLHLMNENSIVKEEIISGGMDLRDYFAAKALQGMIHMYSPDTFFNPERVSKVAYQIADEMIRVRKTTICRPSSSE